MANIITDVAGDKQVVMTSAQFARMPIASIFTGWTQLRVAALVLVNDSGANITGTPRLAMGLCAGTSNIPGDLTVTHFCGVMTNQATWLRNTAAVRYQMANSYFPTKTVGITNTFGSTFSSSSNAQLHTTALQMLFIDITKGSPDYSFNLFLYTGASVAPSVTFNDFANQSVAGVPAFTGHTYSPTIDVAVDEGVDGTFDSACMWWDQVVPTFQVAAWRVFKLG